MPNARGIHRSESNAVIRAVATIEDAPKYRPSFRRIPGRRKFFGKAFKPHRVPYAS